VLEGHRAGARRVGEPEPGRHEFTSGQQRASVQRARRVAPEALARAVVREAAALVREDPVGGQRLEEAVERRRVSPERPTQLLAGARTVGERVGDAEVGGDEQQGREPIPSTSAPRSGSTPARERRRRPRRALDPAAAPSRPSARSTHARTLRRRCRLDAARRARRTARRARR
jgi:hypothetical protein